MRRRLQALAIQHLVVGVVRHAHDRLAADIELSTFGLQPVFGWLADTASIETQEMLRTFNCGVGMVLAVDPANAEMLRLIEDLADRSSAFLVGGLTALNVALSEVLYTPPENYSGITYLTMETDDLGNTTNYTFDFLQRPVRTTNADGTYEQVSYRTEPRYLEVGSNLA